MAEGVLGPFFGKVCHSFTTDKFLGFRLSRVIRIAVAGPIVDHGTSTGIPMDDCQKRLSPSMDVGVDTHDFRPWHYDEIGDIMMKKAQAQQSLY